MKKKTYFVSAASAALTIALLGVTAFATAVPKDPGLQGATEASTEAVSETAPDAFSGKSGADLAIDQPDVLAPITSQEEAEALALEYAELTNEDVTFLKSEKDSDDGFTIYEVDFQYGNLDCSYELNADTGEVLKFSYDVIDKSLLTSLETGPVSQEDAETIALSQVDGASAEDLRIWTDDSYDDNYDGRYDDNYDDRYDGRYDDDYDDRYGGRYDDDYDDWHHDDDHHDHVNGTYKNSRDSGRRISYEGTIIYDQIEYDFEIDAASGEITDWSVEAARS